MQNSSIFFVWVFLTSVLISCQSSSKTYITDEYKDSIYYEPMVTLSWLRKFEKPTWSPDGNWIGLQKRDNNGYAQIYAINTNGQEVICLTNGSYNNAQPTWSSQNQIAFVSDRSGHEEVFLMDANGENIRQLTNSFKRKIWPSFSPDGKMIAYVQYEEQHPTRPKDWFIKTIQVLNIQTGETTEVYSMLVAGGFPSWHPDGKTIYFYQITPTDSTDLNDIYSVSIDGSGLINHTESITTKDVYSIDWSKDGTWHVFVEDINQVGGGLSDEYNWEIFSMDKDSILRRLTNDPMYDGGARISPAGDKIAFISRRNNGYSELFIMDSDGNNQIQLTHQPQYELLSLVESEGLNKALDIYDDIKKHQPSMRLFSEYSMNYYLGQMQFLKNYEKVQSLAPIFATEYPSSTAQAYSYIALSYHASDDSLYKDYAIRSLKINHNNTEMVDLLGFEKTVDLFEELHDQKQLKESQINALGYSYLSSCDIEKASEVLRINTIFFPESANAYDSYAESLMVGENLEEAIFFYQESLKRNPNNQNAKSMIFRLNQQINSDESKN